MRGTFPCVSLASNLGRATQIIQVLVDHARKSAQTGSDVFPAESWPRKLDLMFFSREEGRVKLDLMFLPREMSHVKLDLPFFSRREDCVKKT